MADFKFGLFPAVQWSGVDGYELSAVLDDAFRVIGKTNHRDVSIGGLWCSVAPSEHVGCSQRWRLHVSATVSSARDVLARTVPLLLQAGSAFKFASTLAYPQNDKKTVALAADAPKAKPLRERLAEWLTVRETPDSSASLRTLILSLMDEAPDRRWTPVQARDALAVARKPGGGQLHTGGTLEHHPGGDDGPQEEQLRHTIDGIVRFLVDSMNPTDDKRLWTTSCAHGPFDPCILQLGAAGIIGVLTRCFELTSDQRLPETIATAGRWIAQRLGADGTRPPALYFGAAGIAWALYEAGRALGDDQLAGRGLALADTLPTSSPNPDLAHGTAGICLTFLHLWLRTGNEEYAHRAGKSADELVASASEEPSGISWSTPAAFASRTAGGRYHGFAHGTAGVGYALLAMALTTGRSDCWELAYHAGETLYANAIVNDGIAQWAAEPGGAATAPYWCHGATGVGTFLIRLHHATSDDRFRRLADLAAQAVMENSRRGLLGQCHGLAGNGDFLLDMAQADGGQRYEAMAHQIARVIFASRAYHDDLIVFPDEQGYPSPAWADGASGILAFLLRLRHRSPRMWMVDPLLEWGRS
jgi:Lanthionine synthetase C-like protein